MDSPLSENTPNRGVYGTRFQKNIAPVIHSAISGMPIKKFFQRKHTEVLGKDSGETNYMERWNCTLRQKLARYVRKKLSFSKVEYMHHLVTRWFIVEYNLAITYNHVF
jgi:hypothetical protein